jgi:hypothetical protein
MPVVTPSQLAQNELAPAPSPTPVQTPDPTPAKEASSPSESTKDTSAEPKQAPEKPLSIADKAAAATRARMAEIMGPRRPQGQSSSYQNQGKKNVWRSSNYPRKSDGSA